MVFDCDVLGAPGVGRRMGGPRGMVFIFSVPTATSLYPSTTFLHPPRPVAKSDGWGQGTRSRAKEQAGKREENMKNRS